MHAGTQTAASDHSGGKKSPTLEYYNYYNSGLYDVDGDDLNQPMLPHEEYSDLNKQINKQKELNQIQSKVLRGKYGKKKKYLELFMKFK